MKTQKENISKPLKDLSNIDTSITEIMIHNDDEKNGKLNLVKIKDKKTLKAFSKKNNLIIFILFKMFIIFRI
jgi:hypothetical protein